MNLEDDYELVVEIFNVFLNHGHIKVASIEGSSDCFPDVWAIIEKRIKKEHPKFVSHYAWCGSFLHKEHKDKYPFDFEACPHLICSSIRQTTREIGTPEEAIVKFK